MSIDDLKARQKAALESTAAWELLRKDLEAKFKAVLASLDAEVKAKTTGLEFRMSRPTVLPFFDSNADSCTIRGGEWLTLHVPGVDKAVRIATLRCYITRNADGSWREQLIETGSDQDPKLDVALHKPCIPVRIGWKQNVWWCGPEDNGKLVEALVGALLVNDMPSDFTLKDPNQTKGCVLLLAIGLIGLALSVALFTL